MSQTPTQLAQMQTSAVAQQKSNHPVAMSFFDLQGFELMQRIAKAFSTSDLVPKQYQGNLPNCMIALDMAQRIGANPLMCMQNLYVVHGTPGWSSKFLIATINTCGRYSTLRYEWRGQEGDDDYGCRAWAVERETNERLDGIWVDWKMVKAEGWASKNGSKWKTMPDQMFIYRAAAFWQRAYSPDLGMGLQTQEELQDVYEAKRDEAGGYAVDVAALREADRSTERVNTHTGEILDAASTITEQVAKYEEVLRDHGDKEAENYWSPEVGAELDRRAADPKAKPKANTQQQSADLDELDMG